jgi:hypothetical protein
MCRLRVMKYLKLDGVSIESALHYDPNPSHSKSPKKKKEFRI